jgi:uncharacterized membrane protein YfcA
VWLLLTTAAVLVGFAKTAVGGVGTISVALFALAMPARESTAALLLLLLVGDVIAVATYRRDCDWSLLRHLVPAVVPGLVLGAVVLALVDDDTLRVGLALVLVALVVLQWTIGRRRAPAARTAWSRPATLATGVAAGATTMVANAAGAVMALYLVAQGVDKRRFLGTSAWFFLGINLCKLPLSVGLGLLHRDMLVTAAVLAPAVLVGAVVGVLTVRRLRQRSFENAVLGASLVSAVALLLR